MSMLKTIIKTESVLLLRNRFLAIPLIMNLLFWGAIVISYEMQDVHAQERATVFYSGWIWVLLFNLVVIGLFAVYMTSKDRESEFESLVVTYRVKNTEWILGKWLSAQLYGLSFTLITLVVQIGWFASGKMTFGDLFKNIFYVCIQMEGAFFLLISLGFLAGTFIKNMFAFILIPALLILSLGLPFDYTGVAYTYDNPRLHLLTPFDYMFIASPYEGIWGIHRVFGSTLLHQIIALLLGMVIILVTLLLFRSNRRMQREKKLVPMLMVIFIIPTFLLSGIRYAQYDRALGQFITTGKQYVKGWEDERFYDTRLDHKKYDFSMERAELRVQLQPDHQIKVSGNLLIKNNGDTPAKAIVLTLYHGLNVTECASESKMICTREKDIVTVHFDEMIEPSEQFELGLSYQGNILQYRDEGYVQHSFIANNRVYLPKEAGWYPLIGERQLVKAREHNNLFVQFEQRNGGLIEDFPTTFTVEVVNENKEIPLALTIPEVEVGIYQGTTQYGLSLVGGNFIETTVDEIRVVSHPEVQDAARERVKKYQQGIEFIEEWLEVPITPSVIYILNDAHYYLTQSTLSTEFLVWNPLDLGNIGDSVLAYEIVKHLTGKDIAPGSGNFDMVKVAMEWLIKNHFEEKSGFRDWYLSTWGPVEETKLIDVLHVYEEKGEDELKDIVKFLYRQYSQLEDKDDFDADAAVQLYEGEVSL